MRQIKFKIRLQFNNKMDSGEAFLSRPTERSVPSAHVVELSGASHYLFLTREAEVLPEMHRFVMTLK